MPQRITTLEVRRRLGEILDRVHLRHDRFIIERRGKPLAALVPVDTLEAMDQVTREFLLEASRGTGRRRTRQHRSPLPALGEAGSLALANEAKHESRPLKKRKRAPR